MLLSELSEIVYNYYNEGRASATNKSFAQEDITAMTRLAVAKKMIDAFRIGMKENNGQSDYYFSCPLLTIQQFNLGAPNAMGMQRIDMSGFDMYRLPKNEHIVNIYPIGTGCVGDDGTVEMTQVAPAEENFYLSSEYQFFIFYVVKGQGINAYHLPPCITALEVEATYDDQKSNNVDVSMDIAFLAANDVLGQTLRISGFINRGVDNPYTPQQMALKQRTSAAANPQAQEYE